MVGWLMEHKVIVFVGLGIAAAAFFVMRSQASPTASSGGIGGVNPGNQTSSTDPINAQLTGLQEQLSNMMAGIASKLSGLGGTPGNASPGSSGAAGSSGAPGATGAAGASSAAGAGMSLPISVVTPLPVSGDAWQPPVATAALSVDGYGRTITVAPAQASPVAGAYLGTSLGEGVYAAHVSPPATTGPGIIASLRQAILPVPVAPGPAAPAPAPKPSSGPGPGPGAFKLNSSTSQYYVNQAKAAPAPYHQTPVYVPPTDAAVARSSNRSGPQ